MCVGFCFSVDDLFAALKLVRTVINTLREASVSGATFCELLQELLILITTLAYVTRLDFDNGRRPEKIALRQAAGQSRRTIDEFWIKMAEYQPNLL
ncbi:hypothetical protein HRG_001212 [Hirsutella rhossiliensis]|uniref:Uncharacterized protein n=1 Tax=Hirsutella rhossiliensis TaxID=111463 RepID=A0A9P8SP50_9HYPO|nr:uncharacterized protein HRG_01212 [Hirsutella rhossiliensis]KAH0968570.1 hypothetical protein HRG_01212 [Hirsutella rhossiliensis]